MAKGIKVNQAANLVAYNTKVNAETKDLLTALVAVSGMSSQRELLDKALKSLEAADPGLFERARQFMELRGAE